ncbi:MAG: hypothetical protein R6V05_01485 [Candidatus Brocadiia bacterium]
MTAATTARRSGRRWLWIILALLLLVGGGVGVLYLRGCLARKRLDERLEALRGRGMPTSMEEYLDWRELVPPEQNMALVVLDACDRLRRADAGASHLIHDRLARAGDLGTLWSAQKLDIAQQRLAPLRGGLEMVREAAELEGGYYPLPSEAMPFFMPMDHPDRLRSLSGLLWQSALVHAQQGHMSQATADLTAALRLAASLGRRPLFHEASAALSLNTTAVDALERALAVGEMERQELDLLTEELAREEGRLAQVNTLPGDRAATLQTLLRARTAYLARYCEETADSTVPWRYQIVARIPGARQRGALQLLDNFAQVAKAQQLPWPERTDAVQRAAAEWWHGPEADSFENRLALFFMPAAGRRAAGRARVQGYLRAARTALAVERWRMQNGRWPESLEELVPALLERVPTDPFSGEPLRYRRTAQGVRVYSVWEDQEDQRGLATDEWSRLRDRVRHHDLPFRLLSPGRRRARRMTFREELRAAGGVPLEELDYYGYGQDKLKELGFSESEIREFAFR